MVHTVMHVVKGNFIPQAYIEYQEYIQTYVNQYKDMEDKYYITVVTL